MTHHHDPARDVLVPGRIHVVLGSASPARLGVLRHAGLDPQVIVSDVDEDALLADLEGADPEQIVCTLASAKSEAVLADLRARPNAPAAAVVFTCDSMLFLDGELVGKPHTPEVAVARWKRMRGNSGRLLTGHHVSYLHDGETVAATGTCSTVVEFADIDDATIEAYVDTGEPLAVAGSFTLDGLGGWFVESITGDPSSVIGISLPLVRRLLVEVGVDITTLWTASAH